MALSIGDRRRWWLAVCAALALGGLWVLVEGVDVESAPHRGLRSSIAADAGNGRMLPIASAGEARGAAVPSRHGPAPEVLASEPADEAPLGYIEGRVISPSLAVDYGSVRVAAIPMTYAVDIYGRCGDDAIGRGGSGWLVADCDASGAFRLGPVGSPALEYRLAAAGGGVAHRRVKGERGRAGSTHELELTPVLGVRVRVTDERGRAFAPKDREVYPGALLLLDETVSRIGGSPDTAARVGLFSLALMGVDLNPARTDGRTLVVHQELGRPELASARLCLHHPVSGAYLKIDVPLLPVVGSPVEHLVEIPGVVVEGPPVRLHFPRALAEALVGDGERSHMGSMLEVRGVDSGRAFGFSPNVERGSATWTTTELPPGEYRADFMMCINDRVDVGTTPTRERRRKGATFRVGPGGVDLYVPDLPFAAFELDLTESEVRPGAVSLSVGLDGRRIGAFARFRGAPCRSALFLDDGGDPSPLTFAARSTGGELPLDVTLSDGVVHLSPACPR